jgi:phosphodiesterase/alkaline phosphatase D-like protein
MDDNLRIWRSFQIGKLFDLIMLDTRNYDRSITTLDWNDEYVAHLKDDASRTLMGSHQENWFYGQLSKSNNRGAIWRIIGNQIIFSRINTTASYGFSLNADQWDVRQNSQLKVLSPVITSNVIRVGLHSKPQPHPAPPLHQQHPQHRLPRRRLPRQLGFRPRLARRNVLRSSHG